MKNWLDKIRKSNYDIEKEILVKKYENLVEELERAKKNFDYERISQVYKEKLQTEHDLAKLEDVMTDPKNSRDDRDMRAFNYLDKIEDVLCVIKLLDEKLKQLKNFEKDWKLEINKKGHSTTNNQFRATPKLKKDIELFKSEIANENLSYMLDDDFTNIEMIEKAINDLYNKCHEYRKTPTFIRLQERWQKEKNYSVELCGNESLTEEEKIQQIESEKERKKKNRKIDDEKRHRKKKYMVIPLLFKK